MSTNNFNEAPVSADAETTIPNSFTGKLTYVAKYTNSVQIMVGGGRAPGAYSIYPDMSEAFTIAMAAVTNKANVFGTFENGKVTSLCIYST